MFVLAFPALILSARCVFAEDPWESIRHLPHNVDFVFIARGNECGFGKIKAVTAQGVTVRTDRADVAFKKSRLVRIRQGFRGQPDPPNNTDPVLATVYSGRSSWADVVAFTPFRSVPGAEPTVRMSVNTKDGRRHLGAFRQVSETGITLVDAFEEETSIAKTDISTVDYIRDKPLSDNQEFYWNELAMLRIFDPVLYPRLFHLGDTMSVRLFDNTAPQDDSLIRCN